MSPGKDRLLFTFPGQEKRADPEQDSAERNLLTRILEPYNSFVNRIREIRDAIYFGNSFGIYAALLATGGLAPEDGYRLVDRRGQIVRQTEDAAALAETEARGRGVDTTFMGRTGMLRLIGVPVDQRVAVQRKYRLNTSNDYGAFVVVTGYQNAISGAVTALNISRGVTVLEVDGAFHDPIRQADSELFKKDLADTRILTPNADIVSSTNARILRHPDDIREELAGMMVRPVILSDVLRVIRESGVRVAFDFDRVRSFQKIIDKIDEAKAWLSTFSHLEEQHFFDMFPDLLKPQQSPNTA